MTEHQTNVADQLIEEYRSLREEIMRRQYARLFVLGFSVAGIGTLIGIGIRELGSGTQAASAYAAALLSYALLLIFGALLFTIEHTQQIDVISGYIREFIEPHLGGIRWESRWTRYRQAVRGGGKTTGGLPLGTSKPLSIYYLVLTISVCYLWVPTGLIHRPSLVIPGAVIALAALWLCYDLRARRSGRWKVDWGLVKDDSGPDASAERSR